MSRNPTPSITPMKPKHPLTVLTILAALAAPALALDVKPPQGFKVASTNVKELDVSKIWIKCGNACTLPKAPKRSGEHQNLEIEGRIEKRLINRAAGAGVVGPAVVLREYQAALQKAGFEAMNPGDGGESGPHVFRLKSPGQPNHWVVLEDNFEGYHSLNLIQERTRASTVSVTDMAVAIKADGWATLYVEFDTNKSDLKADGQAAVVEIAKLLRQDPGLQISIDGHTDNVGDASANRKLALARAQAVLTAVVAQGIEAKRLSAKGFGPDVPIADNRREDGRAKNRRVELTKVNKSAH
ncbi:MAG: hypothetical protein RL710_789 [Pseudomonadota bacterium]